MELSGEGFFGRHKGVSGLLSSSMSCSSDQWQLNVYLRAVIYFAQWLTVLGHNGHSSIVGSFNKIMSCLASWTCIIVLSCCKRIELIHTLRLLQPASKVIPTFIKAQISETVTPTTISAPLYQKSGQKNTYPHRKMVIFKTLRRQSQFPWCQVTKK